MHYYYYYVFFLGGGDVGFGREEVLIRFRGLSQRRRSVYGTDEIVTLIDIVMLIYIIQSKMLSGIVNRKKKLIRQALDFQRKVPALAISIRNIK